MAVWDLATKENWELILSDRRTVQRVNNPDLAQNQYEYIPIAPIYTNPNSHVLLIGTYSASAKPYWFLGARASQYLYVSPSTSSNFISGVQASDIKRVGLNRLTLVKFDNYDVLPYTLQLEIPYWLEDIYVEVWEYQGYVSQGYEEVLDRLDAIETQLEDIKNQASNNFSDYT